jgi:hypothetical protein
MAKKTGGKRKNAHTGWRSKLKRLGGKARRGRAKLRARRKALSKKLQPSLKRAKKKLAKFSRSAGEEASAMGAGLGAGFRELRKTYSAARGAQSKSKHKLAVTFATLYRDVSVNREPARARLQVELAGYTNQIIRGPGRSSCAARFHAAASSS